MKLTEKEERMLKGDMGRGVQCAMEVLMKMEMCIRDSYG